MKCSSCGTAAVTGDRFCGSCGSTLNGGTDTAAPASSARRSAPRARVSSARLLIAVAVLVVGGGLAFWALGRSSGGAASPEAAARALIAAVNDEDALGVLAAIDPDESRALRSGYEAGIDQADKQGFVKKGAPFAGVDITATNFTLVVTKLSDDVARVQVTDGTVGYHVDPSKFTQKSRDELAGDGGDLEAAVESFDVGNELRESMDADAAFVVAVNRGGGWYIDRALHTG